MSGDGGDAMDDRETAACEKAPAATPAHAHSTPAPHDAVVRSAAAQPGDALAALERHRLRRRPLAPAARSQACSEMITRPTPMQAMPIHSPAVRRSPKTSIDDSSAMTGIASMLSDAVPAGRKRRTRDPQQEADRRRDRAGPAAAAARRSTLHCASGSGRSERQQGERQDADQHLPGDEVQHVEAAGALEILHRDRAGRPAEPGEHRPQLRREFALPVPRLDDEREPGERAGDREPLHAAHALVQHRPREQQRPERHREHQHRRAAGAAAGQRHRRRAEVDRRLEEAGDDDGDPGLGQQTVAGARAVRRRARRRRPRCAGC